MSRYQKTATPGLVKDKATGMVLNTNTTGYAEVLARRRAAREKQELQEQVAELRREVAELRQLVLAKLGG